MINRRPAAERGHADHGWLQSRHSFSFADYHDPAHMGWGNLRVLNEDRVAAGQGFGRHGHRDMEIVSWVLDGELAHSDSLGNGSSDGAHSGMIRPGNVQRMSAGTGVVHSEFNGASDRPVHFLQIWILPRHRGIAPSYEQKHFEPAALQGVLRRVASPSGADGAVTLHADAAIDVGRLDGDAVVHRALDPTRLVYVHLARGTLAVNGHPLAAGDALMMRGEAQLQLASGRDAEVLVFDLAP